MKVISRKDALLAGSKRYFTGKPCKHGHIAERGTCDGSCRDCGSAKIKRQRAANPEKFRERKRRWRHKNPAKYRAKRRAKKARRRQQVRDQVCGCCTPEQRAERYAEAEMAGVTIDHIIPMSKAGPHCVHNMQLLTHLENSTKQDRYDPLTEGLQYLHNLGLA